MQGRTTYGGASAAISLAAARAHLGPAATAAQPLRSAQVSFVGAAGDESEVECHTMRQGKAMTFVRTDLHSAGRLATHATFAFGAPRESAQDFDLMPPPPADLSPPERCPATFQEDHGVNPPKFLQNFDSRLARGGHPGQGSGDVLQYIWARHVGCDEATGGVEGVSPDVALTALGDVPPPTVLANVKGWINVSSATWHLDIFRPPLSMPGGWFLLRQELESARDGYTAQNSTMWGAGGQVVAVSRQTICVYG